MSKRPVTPQAGGEPPSRGRGADAAPSQPRTGRVRYAEVHSEGAGSSGAMAAQGGQRVRHVSYNLPGIDGAAEQPQGHEGAAGATPQVARPPIRRPSYKPVYQKRQEQQQQPRTPVGDQPRLYGEYPQGGAVPEDRQAAPATPPRVGGHAAPGGAASARGRGHAAVAGGALPLDLGSSHPQPGVNPASPPPPRGSQKLKSNKTIERVSTLLPAPAVPPHQAPETYRPSPWKTSASPMFPTDRRRKEENATKPFQFCFTLCCILFWLLVICIGLAILVVYLLYHPKPPRLHVSTATLNAGYIDELPPPQLGEALNSDLYVLAAIYNPNTKIDVALRYMQLDLYFQGKLVGTQAVWPPLYERPGDSALRSVHLVVSEVVLSHEDAEVWRNATASGGLVEMQLQGKFHVLLNFGRWLPFRYTVRPSCSLWLDPPPAGALRKARCRV
ncbi:hypothetical protein BS78_03G374300 [Paspalum vaginatum]|nr:hypothetical protein BS78_03G374300 [Paspalum vaginatum]